MFTVFLIISYILCSDARSLQSWAVCHRPVAQLEPAPILPSAWLPHQMLQLHPRESHPNWQKINTSLRGNCSKKLMYTHLTEQVPLWDWCQNQISLKFFFLFYMAWNLFKTFSKLHVHVQSLVNGLKAGKPHSPTLGPAGPGSPGSPASPASPWLWKKQQHLHGHNVCVLKRNRKQRSES